MRVIIGYDGSAGADAAIEGLERAGLPKTADILVLAVANIYATSIPVPSELRAFKPLVSERIFTKAVLSARSEKLRLIEQTRPLARQGAAKVRECLPGLKVRARALAGHPAGELLRAAAAWDADLIVVGSNGRSALGRFFLGSVSRTVAETADRSVRIGRPAAPVVSRKNTRIVTGATTLSATEKIVTALAGRSWSADTAIKIVSVDNGEAAGRVSSAYSEGKAIIEQAVEPLSEAGLRVMADVQKGELGPVLADEAHDFEADTIFVHGDDRERLSSDLIESEYTIEIVR